MNCQVILNNSKETLLKKAERVKVSSERTILALCSTEGRKERRKERRMEGKKEGREIVLKKRMKEKWKKTKNGKKGWEGGRKGEKDPGVEARTL